MEQMSFRKKFVTSIQKIKITMIKNVSTINVFQEDGIKFKMPKRKKHRKGVSLACTSF